MKIDGYDENNVVPESPALEEDRQNRREFFNGLGKWSMVVVAALSFLGGGAGISQAAYSKHYRHREYLKVWQDKWSIQQGAGQTSMPSKPSGKPPATQE